ncbi:MAG: TIGR00341 family protein [Armatimonadetes bacterium]|nr:TIGR00341 family protein [Armatimonadota bacterium]
MAHNESIVEPSEPLKSRDLANIRKEVSEGAFLTREYIWMNVLATVVASYGLLQNSTAVVIGAMLIALLLGPINGLALALNDGDWKLLNKALIAEGVGVGLVLLVSVFIGRIHTDVTVGTEILSRTSPNILDLFIALAGGAAGAYALVSPKLKAGIVGVAIATALVPPLSTAGIMFARGEHRLAAGAFLLFVANLVAIQFAASAVLWINGLHQQVESKSLLELFRRNGFSLTLLLGLAIFLFYNFQKSIAVKVLDTTVRSNLERSVPVIRFGASLVDINVVEEKEVIRVYAVVRTPVSIDPSEVDKLERLLVPVDKRPYALNIRSIITKEATKDGWLHIDQQDNNPPATNSSNSAPPKQEENSPVEEPSSRTEPIDQFPPDNSGSESGSDFPADASGESGIESAGITGQ